MVWKIWDMQSVIVFRVNIVAIRFMLFCVFCNNLFIFILKLRSLKESLFVFYLQVSSLWFSQQGGKKACSDRKNIFMCVPNFNHQFIM